MHCFKLAQHHTYTKLFITSDSMHCVRLAQHYTYTKFFIISDSMHCIKLAQHHTYSKLFITFDCIHCSGWHNTTHTPSCSLHLTASVSGWHNITHTACSAGGPGFTSQPEHQLFCFGRGSSNDAVVILVYIVSFTSLSIHYSLNVLPFDDM